MSGDTKASQRRPPRSSAFLLPFQVAAGAAWSLFCALLCRVNLRAAHWVARLVVTVGLGWLRHRRLANLEKLLGPLGWSRSQRRSVNRATMRHLARSVVDLCRLPAVPAGEICAKVLLDGEEHLRTALLRGKGVFLVGNHMGSFPCLYPALAARGYPLTVVVNRLKVRSLDGHLDLLARRFGGRFVRVGRAAPRAARQAFRRNELFCTFLDVTIRRDHEVWLPFGPAALNVDRGIAELARRHPDVPVLLVTVRNEGDHRATVSLRPAPTASEVDSLLQSWLTRVYEEVRQRPEQWWAWSFVILRTR